MENSKRTILTYRVPYADTDQMGVVYYANYLTLFERARNEFLREIGYTYKTFEADGFMLPVAEARCFYKRPAHFDDLLEVHVWCSKCSGARIQMECEVRRDGKVLTTGYTVHACMSMETNRITKVPDELIAKLSAD